MRLDKSLAHTYNAIILGKETGHMRTNRVNSMMMGMMYMFGMCMMMRAQKYDSPCFTSI